MRAEIINAFSPDLPLLSTITQLFIRELFSLNQTITLSLFQELFLQENCSKPRDRYEFLRLIVTEDLEQSLMLSEPIVEQFVNTLNVPLIGEGDNAPYIDVACLIKKRVFMSQSCFNTPCSRSCLLWGNIYSEQ